MASSPYRISPPGIARYPWVNKPDTKFNQDGLYKTDLVYSGAVAEKFRAEVDKAVDAAFDEFVQDLSPADRKKWTKFVPYEVEEDDNGNPTGRIIVKFRQNAVIKVEGERKEIKIAIFDAADKPTGAKVFGGAEIRVAYKARPIKIATAKQAGVRLDFLKVQVIKLAEGSGDGSGGFGSVDGGYVDEHLADQTTETEGTAPPAGADY